MKTKPITRISGKPIEQFRSGNRKAFVVRAFEITKVVRRQTARNRTAFSLLELILATAMLSTLITASMVLIRTSYTTWELHEQDLERVENVSATIRYIVRQVRQANAVSTISGPSDTAGNLVIVMPSGVTLQFSRQVSNKVVLVSSAGPNPSDDLSENITALTFIGYKADGVTQTTTVGDIQVIECVAQTSLPHGGGETYTLRSRASLRTW